MVCAGEFLIFNLIGYLIGDFLKGLICMIVGVFIMLIFIIIVSFSNKISFSVRD
jgi:hypothetical protein